MWWRLAWELGYAHPRQVLEAIDSAEYTEVMAAAGRLLLPDERSDLRSAMGPFVAARIGGNDDAELTDFVVRTEAESDADDAGQTEEEMRLALAWVKPKGKGESGN